ncbi:DUF5320 domain-containing protein [Patescibacteria group bacterium]|nr:DUF5320 domain-containing protein [Patescibacteria group bacterium]
MPALDKTGPQGQGPLTGRALGPCGSGRGFGFGFGRGRGFGRGLCRFFNKVSLTDYQQALEEELADVKKEIATPKKQIG